MCHSGYEDRDGTERHLWVVGSAENVQTSKRHNAGALITKGACEVGLEVICSESLGFGCSFFHVDV